MSTIKVNKIENTATADGGINVNSSGNVGIGTSTVSTRLDVEGNGVPVEINSANSNSNKVQLSDAGTVRGYFGASSTASFLVSGDGGSEQLRVQAAGGISFNGDTAAANALDDYEEGTWTPTISGSNLDLGGGHSEYTKIGHRVFFQTHFNLASGSFPGDTFNIGGLPFTTGSNSRSTMSIVILDASNSFAHIAGQTAILNESVTTIACDMHGTVTLALDDRIHISGSYIV